MGQDGDAQLGGLELAERRQQLDGLAFGVGGQEAGSTMQHLKSPASPASDNFSKHGRRDPIAPFSYSLTCWKAMPSRAAQRRLRQAQITALGDESVANGSVQPMAGIEDAAAIETWYARRTAK